MPSTLLTQVKDEACSDSKQDDAGPNKISFADSSLDKLSHVKAFGNRIKEETKRLVRYPGKALLKRPCINDQDDEIIQEDFTCFFKEHDILMEFKYVSKNPTSGVYVIPSIKSPQVWHGIIFLRAGPFKEGIFRFNILLPDNFPNSAPIVRFTSHVFHPQIHINGVLNLGQTFHCWKRGESHVCDVLKYIKSCFYNLNTGGALNQEASNCIDDNLNEFKAKASECVKQSLKEFEEESSVNPEDDGNLLKIKSFTTPLFNEYKQKMLCEDPSASHAA